MKLQDKRAVITGASQGLGLAIAEAFAGEGAELVLCARTESDLERAAQRVRYAGASKAGHYSADVSDPEQVQRLGIYAKQHLGGVDILVCNAGSYGPKGRMEEVDWNEWEFAIRVNLLGTALCCREFLPALRNSERGKILLISGGGATRPLPFLSAYASAKAAVVRLGETLAEELREARIDVNMVAPGALNTRMLGEILAAGPAAVGEQFYRQALRQKESGGTPLQQAAQLCVHLASSTADGITGRLISAVWDPWPKLASFADELRDSDIYTLRRITPEDRGKKWE